MTEYHEAFWVIVGTAAPVVDLGVIVLFTQAVEAATGIRPIAVRKTPNPFIAVFLILYLSLMAGFLCSSQLLYYALNSTSKEVDNNMESAQRLLTATLALLVVATVTSAIAKAMRDNAAHRADPGP